MSCFRAIDEKIAGENGKVCVKIHRSFFLRAWNRPSVKYFCEQNSRTAGGEFSKEKNRSKTLNEAP